MVYEVSAVDKNAQVLINTAINKAAADEDDRIVKMGEGTFVINSPIETKSNVTLAGSGYGKTTIKLASGLTWKGGSSVALRDEVAMIQGSGVSNVHLTLFGIDGNNINYPKISRGTKYHTMVKFNDVTNSVIDGIGFVDGSNDGILLNSSKNIQISWNEFNKVGHDGVYASKSSSIDVHNNKFFNRTNCSTRFEYSSGCIFANNYCTTSSGGWGGVEITYAPASNIYVHNNYFFDLLGPGVFTVAGHGGAANLDIHNNIFKNCGYKTTIAATNTLAGDGYAVYLVGGDHSGNCYNNVFDKNLNLGGFYCSKGKFNLDNNTFSNGNDSVAGGATLTLNGNDFYNNKKNTLLGNSYLSGDPKYTSSYGIQSTSPMYPVWKSQVIGP